MIKQKIRQLRKEGHSLYEIARIVNLSRPYVGRVARGVVMSKKGKQRYHREVTGIVKQVKIEQKMTPEKVRIMSHLLFDGSVYRTGYKYNVMYINSSKELIDEFQTDMKKCYEVEPSSFESFMGKHIPCYRLKYLSKLIYQDLKKHMLSYSTSDKECFIPENLFKNSKNKIILLRSFWDNEGSISSTGKLTADSKSKKVINKLSEFHKDLEIRNYIVSYSKKGYGKMYKIVINESKENYTRFQTLHLFSKSVVTRGHNIGAKKSQILRNHITNKYL